MSNETKIIIFESTPNLLVKGSLDEIEKLPDIIHWNRNGILRPIDINIGEISINDIDNNMNDPMWRTRMYMLDIIKFVYAIDYEKQRQNIERFLPYLVNLNEVFHKSVSEVYIVGSYDDTECVLHAEMYESIPTDLEKRMEDSSTLFFMIRLFITDDAV